MSNVNGIVKGSNWVNNKTGKRVIVMNTPQHSFSAVRLLHIAGKKTVKGQRYFLYDYTKVQDVVLNIQNLPKQNESQAAVCKAMTPTVHSQEEVNFLKSIIGSVYDALPSKRDWLDPELEKTMKLVAKGQSHQAKL